MFIWTSVHEEAFQTLKQSLISAPVLALPDFSQPFCLETDASKMGIGAVLMQSSHPIAYLSKALGPKSQGLSTYEKEYLAILVAVDQWRHYLQLKVLGPCFVAPKVLREEAASAEIVPRKWPKVPFY